MHIFTQRIAIGILFLLFIFPVSSLDIFAAEFLIEDRIETTALLFNTGFETNLQVVGDYADITGIDHSVSAPNNWDSDVWNYKFNYVGGDSSQRRADIVDDPTGAVNANTGKVNQVLRFLLLSDSPTASTVQFEEIKTPSGNR